MLEKTRGIVLTNYKYSESSLVVHIFTETLGIQAYLVNGVWKKNNRLRAALFQPLSLLNMEVYNRQGKSLQRIKEASVYQPNINIVSQIDKISIALFMAEVWHKTLKVEAGEPQLFDFCLAYVRKLETTELGLANFPFRFLRAYSVVLGISPQGQESDKQCFFDMLDGLFLTKEPMHPFFLDKASAKLFSRSIADSSGDAVFSKAERQWLTEQWSSYYYLHFETIREFKSLRVLQEIFL